MNDTTNKFEVLTGRLQLLKRPTMWIGAIDPTSQDIFIVNDDKVEKKSISYVPAFKKICDEILDNSLDALIEHNNSEGSIKVKMTDESVYIEDDGPGIPVQKKKLSDVELKNLPKDEADLLKDSYLPEIAWCRLFSGSNFQDGAEKVTIGAHGVGSKATAIFSTKFVGISDDGNKRCTVTCHDNLERHNCKVGNSISHGVTVEFWPDLQRFKLSKIEQVYQDLMYQRLLCLSLTFPKIKFSFNGKRINVNDKKFLKMFSEHIEFETFANGFIGVIPNNNDEFNFFTYVNGMHMSRGGSHIDYISSQIVNPIREKLARKYKSIKPADIKNKLTVIAFLRSFPNPKFDSQTKETLTNSNSDVAEFFGKSLDFEAFAKTILKNNAIIEPIVDMFKLKEELKARQELKKVKKIKVKSDKYLAPFEGEQKYLCLCEGASAKSGIQSCLGRNGFGFYAMRGLPLNAYSQSMQKIVANAELKDIINILGLDISKSDEKKTIDFENILITTDNDADAAHITAMLIGWFKRFAPNLFDEGKIKKLITPLIIIEDKKGKILHYFFTVDEFKKFEEKNKNYIGTIRYIKGLGGWERSQLIELFEKNGFENFVLNYKLNGNGDAYIEDWLGNDPEKRKKYLREYSFDINNV